MKSAAAFALLLACASLAAMAPAPPDWRRVATPSDRSRLREWRSAWRQSLDAAQKGGFGAVVTGDPALFDPDHALDDPDLAAGAYRCRFVRFVDGRVVSGAWDACRVSVDGAERRLDLAEGEVHSSGTLYPDTSRRSIFLGSTAFAGERRPLRYAHAAGRDLIGVVERIGNRRWRLVLPWPHFRSQLDLVEMTPAT